MSQARENIGLIPPGWRLVGDSERKHPPMDAMFFSVRKNRWAARTCAGSPCLANLVYITKLGTIRPTKWPAWDKLCGKL